MCGVTSPDPTLAPENAPVLTWLPLVSQGGPTFPLFAPATGVTEQRSITTVIPEMPGATRILRLAPLPFQAAAVFRQHAGIPDILVRDRYRADPTRR